MLVFIFTVTIFAIIFILSLINDSDFNTMANDRHTYNPNGVNSRQVGLRFKPDELTRIQDIAKKENRTLANMTRVLVLRGLEHYQGEPKNVS